jgi:hypothetical protein
MKTLRIDKGAALRSIIWMMIFSFAGVFLLEVVLRQKPVQKIISVPYLGSSHRQLEKQFARIERLYQEEGKIDCIFIGSSMVWLAIYPPLFSESFYRSTGEEIICFNFGVSAMPAHAAGVISEILVNQYHPKVILYGTSARDYAIPETAEDSRVVVDTPYIQFQSGRITLEGWLYTNSFLYRHIRNLNRLIKFDRTLRADMGKNEYELTGFFAKVEPAREEENQVVIQDAQRWLRNFQVYDENITGLEKIAGLSNHNIQVILFETPVLSQYYQHFSNGKADFEKFVEAANKVSADYEIPFIRTDQQEIIPSEGWTDDNHLNLTGAGFFSWWMGEQVGFLANNNKLSHLSLHNMNTHNP